jgi:ABC-2 type transport system permease protein
MKNNNQNNNNIENKDNIEVINNEKEEVKDIENLENTEGIKDEKIKTEKKKKSILDKRSLKYGTNSIILIVAVVAIAVLVNVLVGIPDIKWDLTPEKLYSLDESSKNLLEDLDNDVTIYGLFDESMISGTDYEEVTELLGLYEKYNRVKVEYVDPDRNPGVMNSIDPDNDLSLKKYDIVVTSTVNGQEKKKKLEYYDLFATEFSSQTYSQYKTGSNAEQGITGAIKYVTAEITPVVYFTQGHDEIDVHDQYNTVKNYLERNNYTVKTLNLLTADNVPEDAEIIIVASPKKDLTGMEREKLEEFLNQGGKGVFLYDFLSHGEEFEQFNMLLSDFNLQVNSDKVKESDSQRHLPEDPYTILMNVKSNMIIPNEFNIVLQDSRSIRVLKNKQAGVTNIVLIETSDTAVGESVINPGEGDTKGPLNVAVAAEKKQGDTPGKVLVMGNASFISDDAAKVYGGLYQNGMAFFLQSLNWMFDEDDEIIVPTKNYNLNSIYITQQQAVIIGLVVTIVVPLIILAVGFTVFMRRRHL